jgi:hypothetical protein
MRDPQAIAHILAQHLSEPAGKAILLSGPWGCGKTYLWRQTVAPRLDAERPITVSLFGMESTATLKSAILGEALLRKMSFLKDEDLKTEKKWQGIIFAGLRKGLESLIRTDLASRVDPLDLLGTGLVICLDDVERTSRALPLEEILGIVTRLSETKQARILLIMNEQQLERDEGRERDRQVMQLYRERVLSAHVSVTADVPSTFDLLVQRYDSDGTLSKLLHQQRDAILRMFDRSGMVNLRTLGRALRDIAMVHQAVAPNEVRPEHALFLTALRAEADSGCLRDASFYTFEEMALLFGQGDPATRERLRFYKRYFGEARLDAYSFRRTLYDFIVSGYFDRESLREDLFPKAEPDNRAKSLLAEAQSRAFAFYTDAAYDDFARRVEDLLASTEKVVTAEVVGLLCYATLGSERANTDLPTGLDAAVKRRLSDNAEAGDETFSDTSRLVYSEMARIWKPYFSTYSATLNTRAEKTARDTMMKIISEGDIQAWATTIYQRADNMRLAVSDDLLAALGRSILADRAFHYEAFGIVIEELGKWNTQIVPELADLRTRVATALETQSRDPALDNSDRVRLAALMENCARWPLA